MYPSHVLYYLSVCRDTNKYKGQYESKEALYASDTKGLVVDVTTEVTDAYYVAMAKLCCRRDTNPHSTARIAYTAMHGVGYQWIKRAFEVANHVPMLPVPCQQHPDPEFSTVAFPNPEEKGVSAV